MLPPVNSSPMNSSQLFSTQQERVSEAEEPLRLDDPEYTTDEGGNAGTPPEGQVIDRASTFSPHRVTVDLKMQNGR